MYWHLKSGGKTFAEIPLTLMNLRTQKLKMFVSFFAVVPVSCWKKCTCYFRYQLNFNVYNCSSSNAAKLFEDNNFTKLTNWLDFSNNIFSELCSTPTYLQTINKLDLSNNRINNVCDYFVKYLRNGLISELSLVNNYITKLPSEVSNITSLQAVKLSQNKFICNCEMAWMIGWFAMRNSDGTRKVKDYDKIVCDSGKQKGKLIFKLTTQEMGCYPHILSTGEKVTIGILGTLIVGIVIVIIAISRRWNEVKWFLYLHFNILDKSDRNENLDGKKYDAFISYRYFFYSFY